MANFLNPATGTETQAVRRADVFLVGPLMLWAALSPGRLPGWARLALAGAGVATMVYNAGRFETHKETGRLP